MVRKDFVEAIGCVNAEIAEKSTTQRVFFAACLPEAVFEF